MDVLGGALGMGAATRESRAQAQQAKIDELAERQAKAEQRARAAEAEAAAAAGAGGGAYDWTRGYRAWDAYDDVEELQDARVSEEAKLQEMAAACGVHTHSREDERKVYEMPTDEKLAAMRGFRTRARVYHDEGHHFRATLWCANESAVARARARAVALALSLSEARATRTNSSRDNRAPRSSSPHAAAPRAVAATLSVGEGTAGHKAHMFTRTSWDLGPLRGSER